MKKTLVKLIATVTTLALVAAAPITAFAAPSLTSSKIKIGSLIQPKKQVIDHKIIFNLADPNKYGDSYGDETTEDAQVAYYNSRVEKLEQMKKEKVNVTMEHHGAYVAKKSILRGAKIGKPVHRLPSLSLTAVIIKNRAPFCNPKRLTNAVSDGRLKC